ncbi:uncharacterized protein LOC128306640 [Anopheles moucheti]|uniref:uncharacterized protein LOC128306640 n=1 Tax=Anopheles moucheti TaxID=186751 RepID=UPI0022F033FE|nr:uncharacterized protein LOC128306640 [Anopheles moucheti]
MEKNIPQQLTDQAMQYNEECYKWKLQLDQANEFSDVATVCQDICNYAGRAAAGNVERKLEYTIEEDAQTPELFDTFGPHSPSSILIKTLQINLNDANKTHSQRKIISKSYYNLCHRSVLDGESLHTVYGVQDLGKCDESSVAIYGMLNSRFLNLMENVPALSNLPARNLALFLSPEAGYNRWFNTVTENVLTIERLGLFRDIHNSEQRKQMWHTVLMNLESPYHGARENMLALLKYLIRDERFMRQTVLKTMRQWSWLNRNKYHLLVILLGQYPLPMLLKPLDLDMEQLGKALKLSLRYKHLYTGGQALIRLLHKEQRLSVFVYDLVAMVIVQEEMDIVQVMVKYWFSLFTPKDYRAVYRVNLNLEALITAYIEPVLVEYPLPAYCVSNKHEKLFLLAYLFRGELQKHTYLRQLLAHLCELAETQKPLPPATLGLLIESLGYYIIACGATDRINTHRLTTHLTHYALVVMETPGHLAVCNTLVTVCQKLLKHIVYTQQRRSPSKKFDRDAQALVAKFMSYDMYDRYLFPASTKRINYQPTVTALRLFAAFVEQVLEFTPSSRYVLQMRSASSVEWIAKLLPDSLPLEELGSSFRSMVYGLQHLLRSDYDDVRTFTLKMLYNRTVAYHFDPKLQDQLAIVFSRDDTDSLRSSVHQLLDDSIGKVKAALQHHQRDFYAAVLMEEDHPNGQLHRLVDHCTEICFGFPAGVAVLSNAELFRVHECVFDVWNFTNYALTCAKTNQEPRYGMSFELMDHCLQRLLEQSNEWKTNHASSNIDSIKIALAKRRMQGALWKTIRAVSIFIENAALWLVEHNRHAENSQAFDIFQKYLHTLTTIMISCCHRGAIEAAGNCLSRVVRHLMQLKQNVLASETAPGEDSDRFRPLKRYTAEVKRMWQTWLRYPRVHLEDFRRHRGYIWMLHSYMRHSTADITHDSLLHMYLEEYTQLAKCAAKHEREAPASLPVPSVTVLWLHQLNLLARETALNESILPHIDELMIVALAHIRSPEWPTRNAALQLYSSCTTKLTGQRQLYKDHDSDWAPVYTSFEEVTCKANRTMQFMLRKLKSLIPTAESGGATYRVAEEQLFEEERDPVTPFLLLVLEFLSKLEYRAYHRYLHDATPDDSACSMVHRYRAILWILFRHEHDQVRKLAARCFAQLHDFHTEIPNLLEHLIYVLFTSKETNFRQGLCQAIMACVQKYVTHGRYMGGHYGCDIGAEQSRDAILQRVRTLVGKHYMLDRKENFVAPFRYRCELHKLLVYLGFHRDSEVVLELVINRIAPNMHGLDVFAMQLNQVYNRGLLTAPDTGVPPVCAVPSLPQHSMPYELFLELGHELHQEEA